MRFENEFTYRKFVEKGNESEFDRLFDSAVEKVRKEALGKVHPIYVGGREIKCQGTITEHSPIDGSVIGTFQKAGREEARKAIDAAEEAFKSWKEVGYRERAAIFRKAAEVFRKRKFEISAIMSIENGKTRYESVGEVDEAIDFLNYYAIELERNKGYERRTKLAGSSSGVKAGFQGAPGNEEKVTISMEPYGVFGIIAPFNFPVSISTGMSTGALIAGNTVVFKPSSTDNMTMLTGLELYKVFRDAGLPDGVFNYITGPGSEVGDEMVLSPKVSGIVFTGSRKTGLGMIAKSYSLGQQKVFVVEMGGKNPVVVSKYADIDAAVSGIASAAFGYCGQKCSACSRVYVHDSVKEIFLSKLVEKVRGFRIGNPLMKENYVGPLISAAALERYNKAVSEAERSGRIVFGGRTVKNSEGGIYVEPAIAEVDSSNWLFREELFAPFLVVATYKNFDNAIAMSNSTEYGLTAGIYSRKPSEIREFMRRIEAGVVYANRVQSATTGAIVGLQTFVGWKGSGLTGKGTGSRYYLEQFMREKSMTITR